MHYFTSPELKKQFRPECLGQRGNWYEMRVRTAIAMVAPLAAVRFSGILERPEIVAYRNDRKENQNKEGESDDRRTLASRLASPLPEPEAYTCDRNDRPYEIENWFHAQQKFYMSETHACP